MKKLERRINKFKNDYSGFVFSSGGTTGKDYISFQTKYRNILKAAANVTGWNLHSFSKNHYCFTAVFEKDGEFRYFSISDVRFFENKWKDSILVRTMEHEKDWRGGSNGYIALDGLVDYLN